MRDKRTLFIFSAAITAIAVFSACAKEYNIITVVPTDKAQLGKALFFDKNLSNPIGQSCASCHDPGVAFSDPKHGISAEGAVAGLFSNRNCPSITYAAFTPAFHYEPADSVYVGGFFLDGRVNSLQEQAKKPFLNPLEMNNTGAAMLIAKLHKADYYPLFLKVYGKPKDTDQAFADLADAIANFETASQFRPFTSKFDYYLKGAAQLSAEEQRGLALFNDPKKGNCAACHPSTANADLGKVLFTDFTYDNIGVPKNPHNPFYNIPAALNPDGANALDRGLGKTLNNTDFDGHFKVPGLRNAALTAPYFHNGFFSTLEEVVHFYNKRDVENFPAAEFPATVNRAEMGNLGLSPQEEKDIVAFLKTLTDGYR